MVYSIMDNPIKLDDSILGNLQNPIVDGLIEVIIRMYMDYTDPNFLGDYDHPC